MEKKDRFSIFSIFFGVLVAIGLMILADKLTPRSLLREALESLGGFIMIVVVVGIIVFLGRKIFNVK